MKIFKIALILILPSSYLFASTDYFNEGLMLYEKEEFKKAKFKFEQDIVFNPKNEKSYMYLSKIFNKQEKKSLEEKNLSTVILLNPQNEEATFNMAKLKLEKSDFKESKKLIDQLLTFCKNYCQKSKKLKIEIENSLKK
ncbi:MAG: hypothetical protein CMI71_04465 [Candidatus Pelagibacter sp.]|nr:hypothetical protein [Candidatus Pelagibacter sp.]RPG11029.1 MAG: hypothetical protein CBD30_002345 [Pelagibacteraceae bacterium TMED170]